MSLTFGVEIEFLAPPTMSHAAIANALTLSAGLLVTDGSRNQRASSWKVCNDGSVNAPGRQGAELVSPVLTVDQLDQIDKVCRGLSQLGAVVNRSCGLHAHIGARTLPLDAVKRLVILYAESEPYIDALLPPSRRGDYNGYCRSVKQNLQLQKVLSGGTVAKVAEGIWAGQRNVKLNLTAYWKHGTVEFRQHSGTIDPEKIKNWVLFCRHMVQTAIREVAVPLTTAVPPATGAAVSAMGLGQLPSNSYWRKGRRRRTMYQLLTRPQGATTEELRVAMNLSTIPSVVYHLRRAGTEAAGWRVNGTRNGFTVYKMSPLSIVTVDPLIPPAPVRPQPPTSLEALLDRLQVPPTERTYWIERAALLNEPAQ